MKRLLKDVRSDMKEMADRILNNPVRADNITEMARIQGIYATLMRVEERILEELKRTEEDWEDGD